MKSKQTESKTFQYQSFIETSIDNIIRFHENPDALAQLTPPPLIVQILDDQRKGLTAGSILFRLWFGPIPVRWLAEHQAGPEKDSFSDVMREGPMAYWEHNHIFREVKGGVELMDELHYRHHKGWRGVLTRLMFDGLALKFLFWYRHWRTRVGVQKLNQGQA
ncbi:hypothetical protein MASR2M15_05100 [Anaerolineales bacterium]